MNRIIVLVLLLFVGGFIFKSAIDKGVYSAKTAYENVSNQTKEEQMNKFYDLGYRAAEADNHVSNRAGILIDRVKETANLEVLEVRDVEFVFQGEDENDENITIWLEVPGTGVFAVNLQVSEFIVDNKRNYVLVRVPEPELSECKIDYAGVNKLRFQNDIFNDSIMVGEDIAREMLESGYLLIQKEFASNQRYCSIAKTAAENLIIHMVKELNPTVSNLQVEVEFMK